MSGFNRSTGFFDLTGSQASYWLRRNDIPAECSACTPGLRLAKCLLEHYGVRVVADHTSWLEVEATQAQIWEVLSGQPTDRRRTRYHDK
jgi:hypothetical protein